MNKINNNNHACRYECGTNLIFKGKVKGKKGSTGWFESDDETVEHTYVRCYAIRIEKGLYTTKRNKR